MRIQEKIKAGLEKPVTDIDPAEASDQGDEAVDPAPGEPAVLETEDKSAEQGQDQQDPADADFEWETPAGTGPKELTQKISADPALKAAIDANPEVRDMVFANARLAARGKEYSELFGSPAEARVVAESHQSFANLRNLMGAVKPGDMQTTGNFVSALLEQGALRDENGQILRDAQGNMVTDGTVGRTLTNIFAMRLGLLERQAKEAGDNESLAALDTIMERAGLRTPSSPDEDGMSEELKQERQRLQQERQQLDQRQAQDRQQAQERHDTVVFSKIDASLDKSIQTVLERATGLNDFTRKSVERDIRTGLKKAIGQSPTYQMEVDRIERMPVGQKRAEAHAALAARYVNDHLLRIARPILSEAGITLQKSTQTQQASQAARAEAARSEIKGTSAPARTQAAETPQQKHERIVSELTKSLGRTPMLDEIIAAKIKPAFGSKRPAA